MGWSARTQLKLAKIESVYKTTDIHYFILTVVGKEEENVFGGAIPCKLNKEEELRLPFCNYALIAADPQQTVKGRDWICRGIYSLFNLTCDFLYTKAYYNSNPESLRIHLPSTAQLVLPHLFGLKGQYTVAENTVYLYPFSPNQAYIEKENDVFIAYDREILKKYNIYQPFYFSIKNSLGQLILDYRKVI